MISIEAARDGFVLFVGGERILVHSRRKPCIEIGKAELSFRRVRGSLIARRRRSVWMPLREFAVLENGSERTVIDFGGMLKVSFCRERDLLRLRFSADDPSINLFRLHLQAEANESVYGSGERRSCLDLKGRRIPLWVEEGGSIREGELGLVAAELLGAGRSSRGVSFPMPVFVSSRNYWCSVDCPAYTVLDFRRRLTTTLETWALPREVVLGRRSSAQAVAADLAAVAGRQPPLPAWSYDGAWLGLDIPVEAPRSIGTEVKAALDSGVKLAAVWNQGFVSGRGQSGPRRPLWDRAAPPESLPALRSEVAALREGGVRYLSYADPMIDPSGPLFAEALASGYCVKGPSGDACLLPQGGSALALVDLTNPAAFTWLAGLMASELKATGAVGFIAESGGRLPSEAFLASREDARLAHNRWPILWAEALQAALAAAGRGPEGVYCLRSGWLGSASLVPSAWIGGRSSTFDREDGLPSLIPGMLSLGLSGIGCCHGEVGGSRPRPRGAKARECAERWMEVAAFSPVFRVRLSPLDDGDYLARLARMTEIYAALKPYHLAVANEYRNEGLPAVRHPSVQYGSESELHHRDYQYLYGRDLLVAPALEAGQGLTELYLPQDGWIHLWSSRGFKGGLVTVESPLGCPAVFYRAASPFASLFDSIRRTSRKS